MDGFHTLLSSIALGLVARYVRGQGHVARLVLMYSCDVAFFMFSLIGTCRPEARARDEKGHGKPGRFEAYVNAGTKGVLLEGVRNCS